MWEKVNGMVSAFEYKYDVDFWACFWAVVIIAAVIIFVRWGLKAFLD